MNTSYLKTFVEVINVKNISKAAEKLFITQPAVSKQLQILEKDFATVLIKKDGRDIAPTDAGKELYKYALNVLSQENRIYSKLKREDENSLEGVLNIYSSSLPADYIVPNIIFEFNKLFPMVRYDIKKVDSKIVYNNIDDGLVNFGFTGAVYKKSKLNYISIAEDELIIVAAPEKYKKYKNKTVDIDFLLNNEFISREIGSATLKTFEGFLNTNGYELEDLPIKIRVEDNEIIKNLVQKEIGITVVSKFTVEKELQDGRLIQIKVNKMNLKRQLYFVYHSDRYYSRAEEAFKEFVVENFSLK